MRTTLTIRLIALCAVSITAESGLAVQECSELEGKSLEDCVKYLTQPRGSVEDRCVSYAMDRIGRKGYAPAAEIVVQYVDYQVRDMSHEKNFRIRLGLGRSGAFPAVDAIFGVGRRTIPYLVDRLAMEDEPGAARDNATLALRLICSENVSEAVRILVSASREAADKRKAENLIRAARLTADRCPADPKPQCMEALQK